MKREITRTEYAFSCDICGKLICDVHDRYGRYQAASDIIQKCTICGRDCCPDCRISLSSLQQQKVYEICLECNSIHRNGISKVIDNRNAYKSKVALLKEEYLRTEAHTLAGLRAKGKEV